MTMRGVKLIYFFFFLLVDLALAASFGFALEFALAFVLHAIILSPVLFNYLRLLKYLNLFNID